MIIQAYEGIVCRRKLIDFKFETSKFEFPNPKSISVLSTFVQPL